jgi:hypothetical protein
MNNRKFRLVAALAAVVVLSLLGGDGSALARQPDGAATQGAEPASPAANEVLIFSYAAKFVCHEPIQAAPLLTDFLMSKPPLIRDTTDVLVHNPNGSPLTFYKKAVLAPLEEEPPIDPGNWRQFVLKPDHAVRIDCDDIAKLLTGDPAATFLGKYGVGRRIEGFVVIGIGPQTAAGTNLNRYLPLDVTAQYARGSEVLKKDIHLQPWWRWWWWPLPWSLGYPYERLLPLTLTQNLNVDCRGLLYKALTADVQEMVPDPAMKAATLAALVEGESLGPARLPATDSPPALVALIGRCNKVFIGNGMMVDIDYVLVSNKGHSDPNPLVTPQPPLPVPYPWIPGRWHDLAIVLPQQRNVDLDRHIRDWYSARWTDNKADEAMVNAAMVYFFPWWCGTNYWWGWGPSDCIDIGVGEGESLQVMQVTPSRVFMPLWPPVVPNSG